MQRTSPVSRRYASALVEAVAAKAPLELEKTAGELEAIAKLFSESFDFRNVLLNPAFSMSEREKVLGSIGEKLGLSTIARQFLALVLKRDRFGEIAGIAAATRSLTDQRANRVRAEVTSATELSAEAQAGLRRSLEKRTGKQVELDVSVDPGLLGGIRTRIGSTVFDGTLRAQLDLLADTLVRAG